MAITELFNNFYFSKQCKKCKYSLLFNRSIVSMINEDPWECDIVKNILYCNYMGLAAPRTSMNFGLEFRNRGI